MVINIPDDLALAITQHAAEEGCDPESLTLATLRERFASSPPATAEAAPATLADLLADYIGQMDGREDLPDGSSLSEDSGKKFADLLARRRKQ